MAAILLYLYRRLKAKESFMPTTMNRNTGRIATERVLSQKVCIALGIFFVFVGLTGIVTPGLLGMHLSFIHNSIHLASGALAIWTGYSDNTKRSYAVCVSLGLLYSVIGVLGFVYLLTSMKAKLIILLFLDIYFINILFLLFVICLISLISLISLIYFFFIFIIIIIIPIAKMLQNI
jgi:hypothetical protein